MSKLRVSLSYQLDENERLSRAETQGRIGKVSWFTFKVKVIGSTSFGGIQERRLEFAPGQERERVRPPLYIFNRDLSVKSWSQLRRADDPESLGVAP